ncbi:MAG: glycoside hydrolase family 95 protein [Treponema sp.]|jgi:alpha-L-fucosidase 2|nr:glycoside hydrolase family 95 protein [Treponema sp.]
MKLWYKQEAEKWTEALPVGNGRLGAMVFGKTGEELIPINEDTLWSGYPRYRGARNKAGAWAAMRDLAREGKFEEAQQVFIEEHSSPWTQSYLPLGDLLLALNHGGASGFRRELDLDTATASVSYEQGGVKYRREIFAAAPDDCLAIRLSADQRGKIGFTLRIQSQLRSEVSVREPFLALDGIAPSNAMPSYVHNHPNPITYSDRDEEKGMRFTMLVLPVIEGGRLEYGKDSLSVSGADSALLLVNARTSFAGWDVQPFVKGRDEKALCRAGLEKAAKKSYTGLLKAHTEDFQRYYRRVELDLGDNENAALPTDERLRKFYAEKNDPALYALLFQYGRYLLISSSRPGTVAANLQGIWNSELQPPWSSNFTSNINVQMNYWPALPCALEETQLPLVDLVKALSAAGKETAKELYGAPGFAVHHNVDIWAASWPVGDHGGVGYAAWPLGGGWLCEHLFERYEYTLDKTFLEETAYPVMQEAARFLIALLSDDGAGRLWVCPSTSPENAFVHEGKRLNMARTTTMTMAIVRELLSNCVKAAGILGKDADFAAELETIIPKLYPFKVGSKGQLLEWDEEYEEVEPHHRHTSHLYGLHPGCLISPDTTPELAAACRRSLELRGDDGTGWSLAWKVNFWARLHDGDHALTILNNQLRLVEDGGAHFSGGGTYANMFDAHPPFQIDGNFGVTAGIAEMLLQNTADGVHVLPALPSSWKKGSCKGLRAKRRLTVDLSWDGDKVQAAISSAIDQTVGFKCRGGPERRLELKAGKVQTVEWDVSQLERNRSHS